MAKFVRGGARLRAFFRQAKNAQRVDDVQVGFFATAKYDDGTPVAAVALWNEFGTKRIPERPFFRQAIQGADRDLTPIIKANLDPKTLAIDRPLAGKLGTAMKGRIQKSITTLRTPPNAPSTIKAKGSSNPLIDEGFMRKSVTYKIVD